MHAKAPPPSTTSRTGAPVAIRKQRKTLRSDYEGVKPIVMGGMVAQKKRTGTRRSCVSIGKDDVLKRATIVKPNEAGSPAPGKLGAAAKRRNQRPKLDAGTIVNSESHAYYIIDLIGAGGFGDVYKVEQNVTKEIYALKTEQIPQKGNMPQDRLKVELCGALQIETTVMSACNKVTDPEKRRHFVRMVDKGFTDKFKFLVMDLVGPSIDDLRRHVLGTDFSRATATKLSIETLQGIACLHHAGFLHRDIKPQNFACSRDPNSPTIYILDFGIARQYTNRNSKEVRPARDYVKFLGTIRYASRSAHRSKEQSRKDDVEQWIFLTAEMYDIGNLSWRKNNDRGAVLLEKEKFFQFKSPHIWTSMPATFKQIMKTTDAMGYETEPDYPAIQALIELGARESKYDTTLPQYDD
uniref:Protein kinase domain-containing protein n=1 Tax=Panagrellus redivivus TaxID=6233 RepID=A0A7E4V016_PANRE